MKLRGRETYSKGNQGIKKKGRTKVLDYSVFTTRQILWDGLESFLEVDERERERETSLFLQEDQKTEYSLKNGKNEK
jgi:hypothetical protein